MKTAVPRLAGISLHPVKSTAVREVPRATIRRHGLVGDREWMVVDGDGCEVTVRELPSLLHVVAGCAATGGPDQVALRLDAPGVEGIEVDRPAGGERAVRLFGQTLRVRAAGDHVDDWLRRALGRDDLSLVWCAAPEDRQAAVAVRPTDTAAFQDDSAVSLVSTASIAQLNEWIDDPVPLPASRFRANLLVDGVEPFAEDGWRVVRIGTAELRVVSPINRCVIAAVDPVTLTRGKDPIRTLARHRSWSGKTWFAVHLVVERPGSISVGDTIEV